MVRHTTAAFQRITGLTIRHGCIALVTAMARAELETEKSWNQKPRYELARDRRLAPATAVAMASSTTVVAAALNSRRVR